MNPFDPEKLFNSPAPFGVDKTDTGYSSESSSTIIDDGVARAKSVIENKNPFIIPEAKVQEMPSEDDYYNHGKMVVSQVLGAKEKSSPPNADGNTFVQQAADYTPEQIQEAASTASMSLQTMPEEKRAEMEQRISLYAQNFKSIKELSEKVNADPSDVKSANDLGSIHAQIGDYATATSLFSKNIEDPESKLGLAFVAQKTGDLTQAESLLNETIKHYSDAGVEDANSVIAKGGSQEEALSSWTNKIADPNMQRAIYNLASVYGQTDRADKAMPMADEWLKADPKSIPALQMKAFLSNKLGDKVSAVKYQTELSNQIFLASMPEAPDLQNNDYAKELAGYKARLQNVVASMEGSNLESPDASTAERALSLVMNPIGAANHAIKASFDMFEHGIQTWEDGQNLMGTMFGTVRIPDYKTDYSKAVLKTINGMALTAMGVMALSPHGGAFMAGANSLPPEVTEFIFAPASTMLNLNRDQLGLKKIDPELLSGEALKTLDIIGMIFGAHKLRSGLQKIEQYSPETKRRSYDLLSAEGINSIKDLDSETIHSVKNDIASLPDYLTDNQISKIMPLLLEIKGLEAKNKLSTSDVFKEATEWEIFVRKQEIEKISKIVVDKSSSPTVTKSELPQTPAEKGNAEPVNSSSDGKSENKSEVGQAENVLSGTVTVPDNMSGTVTNHESATVIEGPKDTSSDVAATADKSESTTTYSVSGAEDKISGSYYEPHMTETKDKENYVFFHVSDADKPSIMKGIDSRKHNSLRTSRDEKGLQYGVASFYTKPTDGERMVGGEKYTVVVPKDKVYPIDTDPNGYRKKAEQGISEDTPFRDEQVKKRMAELAQKDGFKMIVGEWNYDRATGESGELPSMRADAIVPLKPSKENVEYNSIQKNIPHPDQQGVIAKRKLSDFLNEIYLSGKSGPGYDIADRYRVSGGTPTEGDFNKIYEWLPKKLKSNADEVRSLLYKKNGEAATVTGNTNEVSASGVTESVDKSTSTMTDSRTEKEKIDREAILKNSKSEIDRVVKSEPNENGDGQTFNLDGTTYSDGGLVIPVVSENLKVSELTPERVADFVEKNKDKLAGDSAKVGIYKFPNGEDASIDINIIASREMRDEALSFGKEAGQESLFDLDTFESVKTGADGKSPREFTDQEFKDIAKRFSIKPSEKKAESTPDVTSEGVESVSGVTKEVSSSKAVVDNSVATETSSLSEKEKIDAEKMVGGGSVKAATNRYSGITETPEQKSAKSELKTKILAEVKASREGYAQGKNEKAADWKASREKVSEFKDKIKAHVDDLRKSGELAGKIPTRIIASLTKKVSGIKTEVSLNNAIKFIDKILSDKNYADEISSVRDLKRSIRSKLSRSKATFGNKTDIVKKFIAIDETAIDSVSEYHKVLEELNRPGVPNVKLLNEVYEKISDAAEKELASRLSDDVPDDIYISDEVANGTKKLHESIDAIVDTEIKSFDDYLDYKRKLSNIKRAITTLKNIDGADIKAVQEHIDYALARAKEIHESVSKEIHDTAVQMSGEAKQHLHWTHDSFDIYRNEAISELSKFDDNVIADMGIEKADLYNKLSEQASLGFFSPRIWELKRDYDIHVRSRKFTEEVNKSVDKRESKSSLAKRLGRKAGVKLQTIQDILEKISLLQKALIDQALGIGDTDAYWNNVAGHISAANVNMDLNHGHMMQKYYNAAKRVGENSRIKVGLILKQIDFQSTHPDFENLPEAEKDISRFLIKNKSKDVRIFDSAYLNRIRKILDEISPDGNLVPELAIEKLSKKERALFDAINEVNDQTKIMNEISAEKRGLKLKEYDNYYKRIVISSKNEIEAGVNSLVSSMENLSTRASSTHSRSESAMDWTIVDPDIVMKRAIRESLIDFHMSDAVNVSLHTLKEASNLLEGDRAVIANALKENTRETLIEQFNIARISDELSDMLNPILSASRNFVLSTPTRIPQELIPNTLKYFISEASGKDMVNYMQKMFGKGAKAYNELMFNQMAAPVLKGNRYSVEVGSGEGTVLKKYADAMSTISDAVSSRNIWKTEFDASFKKLSGEEFNPEAYLNDVDYREKNRDFIEQSSLEAGHTMEKMAGPQTGFTAPNQLKILPILKNTTNKRTIAGRLVGWMQNYNLFEQKTFYENFRDVISGDNRGSGSGSRYVAGVVAANVAYIYLSYAMVKSLNILIKGDDGQKVDEQALRNLGLPVGDGDVNGDEVLATHAGLTISAGTNLLLGGYSATVKPLLAVTLGMLRASAKVNPKMKELLANSEIETAFKEYGHIVPLDFDRSSMRNVMGYIPAVGMYLSAFMDGAVISFSAIADKIANDGIDSVTDDEKNLYNFALSINALISLLPALQYPGMAAVNKVLRTKAQEAQAELKKEKAEAAFRKKQEKEDTEKPIPGKKARGTEEGAGHSRGRKARGVK